MGAKVGVEGQKKKRVGREKREKKKKKTPKSRRTKPWGGGKKPEQDSFPLQIEGQRGKAKNQGKGEPTYPNLDRGTKKKG